MFDTGGARAPLRDSAEDVTGDAPSAADEGSGGSSPAIRRSGELLQETRSGTAAAAAVDSTPGSPSGAEAGPELVQMELEGQCLSRSGSGLRRSRSITEADLQEQLRHVHVAHRNRKVFLWVGSLSIFAGLILAIIGIVLGWEKSEKFPIVIGGYCAVLATLLSIFQILEHLSAFADPDIQSRIVRVLGMVPIYGITSWLAMCFTGAGYYLDLVRDMYESYAIYTFFSLMIGLLGGLDECMRYYMVQGQMGEGFPHPWPLCCLRNWYMLPHVLIRICGCILQFMVLKPLCTFIVIGLSAADAYEGGFLDFTRGYVYIMIVYNISITAAFSALYYFYVATKVRLKAHDPLLKFACIKGVIFLSYWQSLTIDILHSADALPRIHIWDGDEENRAGLQDFLICCEMLLFAIAHKFVFGAYEYTSALHATGRFDGSGRTLPFLKQGIWRNLKRTLRHEDVTTDFKETWMFIRFKH